jgi:hypothetical protein|tara:strand:- start:76 stop:297 length:222 start_codon:yes stop_codon:yes gene_type:complete
MNVEELISLLENENGKSEVVLAYRGKRDYHDFSMVEDVGIDLECSVQEPIKIYEDPIDLEEQEHRNCVVLWPY